MRSGMGTGLAAFFALLIMTGSVRAESPAGSGFKMPEKNFETPEAAIKHFAERLAANDLSGAFEACAINEGDQFDFRYQAKRLHVLLLIHSEMPVKTPMAGQINKIMRMNRISQQIKLMIYSIFTEYKIDGSIQGESPDDEQIEAFIADTDTTKLAGLKVVKMRLPGSKEQLESGRVKENAKSNAKAYQADDSTERVVLYRIGAEYFYGGMRLMKFGKYWRIDQLTSMYAGLSSLGTVQRITPEEFDQMFGE